MFSPLIAGIRKRAKSTQNVELKPNVLFFMTGIVALAAAVFAACGGHPTPVQSPASGSKAAPDFPVTLYQGQDVLGGSPRNFSDLLKRDKPVVLNFWAGACPPCRAEMPDLEAFYQEYKGRVLLFGLDVGPFLNLGSREDGLNLAREIGITYPVGSTEYGSVVRDYSILGMPTTVFITKEGKIFRQWIGLLNKATLVKITEEMLKLR